jgi:site-specific DNA-methyltransferase (adenine-specific)
MNIELIQGNCLIESDKIESGSVDLILTDLPYGTVKGAQLDGWNGTKTDWDEVIDTNEIYKVANRILRKNGKMVLFAQQPFTTELISKQIANVPFNYCMIWMKDHFANSLIAKKAPVNYYEDFKKEGGRKKKRKRFTSTNFIWRRNVALAYNVKTLGAVADLEPETVNLALT